MRVFLLPPLVMVLLADVAFAQGKPAQASEAVGRIVEIKGSASIRERGQAKAESLSARDKARKLYPGEVLECHQDCTLKIILGDDAQGRLIPIKKGTRYPIPNRLRHLGSVLPDWIRAGSMRAQGALLVTPTIGGYMRPESFQFRWEISGADQVKSRSFTFTLSVCDTDQVIWSEANIEFAQGSFTTAQLRAKLKSVQGQLANPRLEVMVTSLGLTQRFCLRMLTADDEKRLQEALTRWAKFPVLISHAQRGYEFYQFGLYDEAATEYKMALQQAPESTTLLAEAIVVNYRLGDLHKVDELLLRFGTVSPHDDLYVKLKAVRDGK